MEERLSLERVTGESVVEADEDVGRKVRSRWCHCLTYMHSPREECQHVRTGMETKSVQWRSKM